MTINLTRRQAITIMAGLTTTPVWTGSIDDPLIKNHDQALEGKLRIQETNIGSPWRGGYPDSWGIYHCGGPASILEDGAASFLTPSSKYHQSSFLFERMKLAAEFLERAQTPDGNIDLLTTNFNSPPDTAFVVHHVARAAKLAVLHNAPELSRRIEPFLTRAGLGMVRGGIHTPNHRWVVSAALAQIHDLYPNPSYLERIDQWLAEGIDIDEEGQFTERSTTIYNAVCDNALVVIAHKLQRPELLDPVRRNLDAMLYLVHPNDEVVTEISRRQDLNARGGLERYWFALRYLAIKDRNGQYATLLKALEPKCIQWSALMEYPELQSPLPETTAIPTNFVKEYPLSGITRIRRGDLSATLIHRGSSRFFSLRKGQAVINAIRFASAFFGKGQFIPETFQKVDGVFQFEQNLRAQYYQPLSDPSLFPVTAEQWGALKAHRAQTEICTLNYKVSIVEIENGFEMEIQAQGTDRVPLALEFNLREGGVIEGIQPAPNQDDGYLLAKDFATYKMGTDTLTFGPGKSEHAYTQIRGAQDKLAGPSIYITGFTPFRYTIKINHI